MRSPYGSHKAFATIEYMVLIFVIILALVVFRGYIQRAYQGQVGTASETFSYGRQYDPQTSMACVYDDKIFKWYSQACYDHKYAVDVCKTSLDEPKCRYDAMRACGLGCETGN